MSKPTYKTEVAIIRSTMLESPNPMFMPWTVDFCNERFNFKTPFRSKRPNEFTLAYVNQFIDFLNDYLIHSKDDKCEIQSIFSIYVKNFLSK